MCGTDQRCKDDDRDAFARQHFDFRGLDVSALRGSGRDWQIDDLPENDAEQLGIS